MSRKLRILATALSLANLAAVVAACSTDFDESDATEDALRNKQDAGSRVSLHERLDTVPGSKDNKLKVDLVANAMHRVQRAFYPAANVSADAGGSGTDSGADASLRHEYEVVRNDGLPSPSERNACLSACPDYWSDIVCVFYCYTPSYNRVTPNVRGCFSNIARSGIVARPTADGGAVPLTMFPDIYQYCTYAETTSSTDGGTDGGTHGYDFAAYPNPADYPRWNEEIMLANKRIGKKPGTLKWVDNNIREAFQHVMYTWYNPFAFTMESQQAALNKFFGVNNPNDLNECKQKRPVAPYDPTDGTHCQATKTRTPALALHPNYNAIMAYMSTLPGGEAARVDGGSDGGR